MLKTNIEKLTKIVIIVGSLLLIGCELEPKSPTYDFELYPESLTEDKNGYYHFDLSEGIVHSGISSRTKIVANTNNPNIQKVGFAASDYWNYDNMEIPLINGASYTKDGFAYSWMAVPFTMINDTIYIKSRYFDEYEAVEYIEKIGVIMK